MSKAFLHIRNLRLPILLAVVIFQSCISATSTDFPIINSSSYLTSRLDHNGIQNKRNLRVHILATTDDNSDERGVNLGAATVTKLKDLTTSATQKLEKFVVSAKLMTLKNNHLATDKSFAKFDVGTAKSNVFESTRFQKWFNSVHKAYKQNVEESEVAVVTTLTKHYGDESLTKLLSEAKTSPNTKVIAEKLEDARLTKWLTEQKSVDDIFNLLKLDETGENVFKSPLLSSWVNYANKFQKNPDEIMFSTLKTHFDDETLAKMLVVAKEDSSNIATKLEKVEFDQWLNSGKTSDDVFKLLSLNDDTGNLLKNPIFKTWVSYVTRTGKQSPYDFVFSKLLARYDDLSLAKLIYAAKRDHAMSSIAEKLEVAQLKAWRKSGKSSDDVFKLLSLEKVGVVDLLKRSLLNVWMAYVKILKKNPDEVLLSKLRLRHSDEWLVKMLLVAENDYRSKDIANRLQGSLQKTWINDGKTADDVFSLLKLGKEGDSVFTSPMWSTWNVYLTKLNKENPDESMYLVLKAQFGEEKFKTIIDKAKTNMITKNIADRLQEEAWRSEGKTMDDIFKLLKLGEKGDKFVESPMLTTWTSYVASLEKLKEKPNEFVGISYLEKRFGDLTLARILSTEKHQHSRTPEAVVTDLQQLQFKKWVNQNDLDPAMVGILLATKEDIRNTRVTLDFYYFYNAHNGSPFY
ncbi:RxLR effector protein [Phytophthora megakarya]|uniref:RxLR effector protein n=1 Tax=Phytophthora megakarya TaxID=4795 RepID=A0A225VWR0_9STRA|nr:RxLR effector protein [Phytophthora megakarya]